MLDLSSVPNFCSHEHWGSFPAIGMVAEGYRADVEAGALPHVETTLLDLTIEAYLTGWLGACGVSLQAVAREKLGTDDPYAAARTDPVGVMRAFRPVLRDQQLTGTYQCTRRGIQFAYGYDLNDDDAEAIGKAQRAIGANYAHPPIWYRKMMAQAHFSELIRPVHPEYFVREGTAESAKSEREFTHPIMRIDPLLELWPLKCPRRVQLAEIAGVEPHDAASWRRFLDALFSIAAEGGSTGIKQLQAYSRPLDFDVRDDSEVAFSGDLDKRQVHVFQDWVMHECCKRADDAGWPHQVHVGTHNLPESNPMPLQALARRYPRQKIVMLHCWPYLVEAGWLAKHVPNIYIDTCWQPVLNPAFLREALTGWINYVPVSKMMLAHDSTTVEMAIGSSLFTREILADVLTHAGATMSEGQASLRRVAADMLHNNAVAVYGVGTPHTA